MEKQRGKVVRLDVTGADGSTWAETFSGQRSMWKARRSARLLKQGGAQLVMLSVTVHGLTTMRLEIG